MFLWLGVAVALELLSLEDLVALLPAKAELKHVVLAWLAVGLVWLECPGLDILAEHLLDDLGHVHLLLVLLLADEVVVDVLRFLFLPGFLVGLLVGGQPLGVLQFAAMQLHLLFEQFRHAVVVLLVGSSSLDLQFGSKQILSLVDVGQMQMMGLELLLIPIPGLILLVKQKRHLLSVGFDPENCLIARFASLAF